MLPLPPLWVAIALAIAPVATPAPRPPAPSADSVIADAATALARGRPWQASRLIAVLLADSARRTPDALMLAATAASRWGGWREVTQLLDGQPWLDTAYEARGRRLLARAALEQGADSAALTHALAIPVSADDTVEGDRLVLLATALERAGARDSAARAYARAAARMPTVAGWLRIRAAAVTADSVRRAELYSGVADPLARDRIGWTEAAARRGTGDLRGAADCYLALGARATSLRLRLASSSDSAHRAGVRRDLVALIAARRSPGEVRDAVALLDSAFAPLSPAEQLEVGRSAGSAGSHLRAAEAFASAFAAGLGTAEDRIAYGTTLSRLGRQAEAARQFGLVLAPRGLAANAAYQRPAYL